MQYYSDHKFPPGRYPSLRNLEIAFKYLENRRKELNFRLKYPFGQDSERDETRKKLEEVLNEFRNTTHLLSERRRIAEPHWRSAKAMDDETTTNLNKSIWHWSRDPRRNEDLAQEGGMDWLM